MLRSCLSRGSGFAACLALAGLFQACDFFGGPSGSLASAYVITDAQDLIGGPGALGQVGDYKLQNGKIRVIIQNIGFSRGFGVYGGSLIDADLQPPGGIANAAGGTGNDRFGEMFPAFFLQAVDPDTVTVTNDGSNGQPATVTVSGDPGPFLTLTEFINTAVLGTGSMRFSVEYSLGKSDQFVAMTSSMTNTSPFPENFPTLSSVLGVTLPVPLGQIALFGASNKVFVPGTAGFDLRWDLPTEVAASPKQLPALPGVVSDFIASKNTGVSYGFFADPSPNNYAWLNRDQYGPATDQGSLETPFFFSSFLGFYYAVAPAQLAPGESFSYHGNFAVGRGDVASIRDIYQAKRGIATGQFSGQVRDQLTNQPLPNISVVIDDAQGLPFNQHTTDANGLFSGTLPPGQYAYRCVDDAHYTQPPTQFTMTVGHTTEANIFLTSPAILSVQVSDTRGLALPSKVSVEGIYPLPPNEPAPPAAPLDPRFFLFDLKRGERRRPTDLVPDTADPMTRRYLEATYQLPQGSLGASVRPGQYTVYVSHGIEYNVFSQAVTLVSGQQTSLAVTLDRVVDTTGYVAGDLHMHSTNSIDATEPVFSRVIGAAAEGLEFVVATDHNFITDYTPFIYQYNLQQFLMPIVGLELTTLELGHFNAYPLDYSLAGSTHGSFSWFERPATAIFDDLRAIGKYGPSETVVQVNHPRDTLNGYFNNLNLDPESALPEATGGLFVPQGPAWTPEAYDDTFDALEVINGKRRDLLRTAKITSLPSDPTTYPAATNTTIGQPLRTASGQIAFPGAVDDWFHLLNRGYRYTPIGNSDSHSNTYEEPGYPRTFVRIGVDDPYQIRDLDVARAIKAHATTLSNGPFVELFVDGQPVGSSVTYQNPSQVTVRVQKPDWLHVDTLNLYVNASQTSNDAPAQTYNLQDQNSETWQTTLTITADSWVVAEVTGSQIMWPLVSGIEEPPLTAADAIGTLGSSFGISSSPVGVLTPSLVTPVYPYAITSPIWVDYEGDGQWTPPGNPAPSARVAPGPAVPGPSPIPAFQAGDVRAILKAFADTHDPPN